MRKFFLISFLALGTRAWAADPVRITLDFRTYLMQLDAPEGASVCQFHASDPVKQTISAARTYATLGGFPDDSPSTDFGRFCDVAFSTKRQQGMGLSQIWSTPGGFQTPQGSVGKHYSPGSWRKLDFSMYHADPLPPERYLSHDGRPVRGHTVPMLLAALRRAREENTRILFWTDLHTDYPLWMWKNQLRRNPVPEQYWEEAVLHIVYYAKYLSSKYGVPVHTVSLQNEPDLPSRHQFTPEMLIRMSKLLRERLDEAGLQGVRILPFTSFMLNRAWGPNHRFLVDTLSQTELLLQREYLSHQKYVDVLGGHMSHGETAWQTRLPNVRFWRGSGDFDTHWKGPESVIFDMGPDDQLDEVIRTNMWLYGQGVNLAGIWQVALRMGHTVDNFVMPSRFDIAKDFRHAAIDGAATVFPFVRPGMFLVRGSLTRAPREAFSVDGFGGRGHREAIVITNSSEAREFRINIGQGNAPAFDVYQAAPANRRRTLEPVRTTGGHITLRVPADSVTTLVAQAPATRPAVYLVVKNAQALTPEEVSLQQALTPEYDITPVSEALTQREQDTLGTKRHPVDPMGAAAYVIAPSVALPAAVIAHKVAMAPVVAVGAGHAKALGIRPGARIQAGAALSFRDPLDPPAEMLEAGLPKACGVRAAVGTLKQVGELRQILSTLERK